MLISATHLPDTEDFHSNQLIVSLVWAAVCLVVSETAFSGLASGYYNLRLVIIVDSGLIFI